MYSFFFSYSFLFRTLSFFSRCFLYFPCHLASFFPELNSSSKCIQRSLVKACSKDGASSSVSTSKAKNTKRQRLRFFILGYFLVVNYLILFHFCYLLHVQILTSWREITMIQINFFLAWISFWYHLAKCFFSEFHSCDEDSCSVCGHDVCLIYYFMFLVELSKCERKITVNFWKLIHVIQLHLCAFLTKYNKEYKNHNCRPYLAMFIFSCS